MAKIDYQFSHDLSRNEALARIRKLMDDFSGQFGSFVDTVKWSDDESHVLAVGKMFQAEIWIDEEELKVSIDLPGFAGKLLAPKVESKLKDSVQKVFS